MVCYMSDLKHLTDGQTCLDYFCSVHKSPISSTETHISCNQEPVVATQGVCDVCCQHVMANQPRYRMDDAGTMYSHEACNIQVTNQVGAQTGFTHFLILIQKIMHVPRAALMLSMCILWRRINLYSTIQIRYKHTDKMCKCKLSINNQSQCTLRILEYACYKFLSIELL